MCQGAVINCIVDGGTDAPEVVVVERKLWKRRGEDVVLECDIVAQPVDEKFWERMSFRLQSTPGKYNIEVVLLHATIE